MGQGLLLGCKTVEARAGDTVMAIVAVLETWTVGACGGIPASFPCPPTYHAWCATRAMVHFDPFCCFVYPLSLFSLFYDHV